ncbi:hypothetical protein SDJN02_18201 [Cucurbita argyrosperma subsp. argyrosperma]|nr:hypothetical protein SDJN02_18201 [Cucurbita argyrosperma subsp. argyrosperma]
MNSCSRPSTVIDEHSDVLLHTKKLPIQGSIPHAELRRTSVEYDCFTVRTFLPTYDKKLLTTGLESQAPAI